MAKMSESQELMKWQQQPPYSCDDVFETKYKASCFCGKICFEARADPVDAKMCHCRSCQSLQGAPMQWAVIFHKKDIRFTKGVESLKFYNSEKYSSVHELPCKVYCNTCNSPLADEGRRMFLAFGSHFQFGKPRIIPDSFKPTCHIFYSQRVIDVADNLPKHDRHKERKKLPV
eukprot:TRINITY_DN844_c0_g1_i2.p2 TRINITY_DN844_c0_g1~~TRINITY_DN844_c0_g1_i2.p2  ORF type:complete len:173 (-),score=19.39 TRINITY_DN844_c0_g1_i2:40-558(-)